MAISNNYVPVRELGNGVTTEYSSDWAVLNAAYIQVFLENFDTGISVPQTLGTDFTLVFSDSGFTVTFLTAPTEDNFVVIGREVTPDQTNPYRTSKGFQGGTLEDSLDKLTAMVQDLNDFSNRSLKFPLGSTALGILPEPIDGNILIWDGNTGAVKNGGDASDIANAQANAAAAAASAAISQTSATSSAASAVLAQNAAIGYAGGFINKFRNGAFDIWQRGTSFTLTAGAGAVYTADGWMAECTGANVTVNFVGPSLAAKRMISFAQGVGITGTKIRARIESWMGQNLAGKQCTLQFTVYNAGAASFTPKVTINHANSVDNFSAVTADFTAQNLQACPTGFNTVHFTFTANSNSGNGLEVILDFGSALGGATGGIYVGDADIRVGATVQAVEYRAFPAELAFCQRYYNAANYYGTSYGSAGSGTGGAAIINYPVTMRATPTVALSGQTYTNASAAGVSSNSPSLLVIGATATALGNTIISGNYTATAEL